MNRTKACKAMCLLAAMGAVTVVAADKPVASQIDWRKMMTIAETKRDAQGQLQPLQSYDETIRRGMDFLLKDHLKWFKGPPETLLDEKGQTQMPWVYYSNLQQNGAPFPNSVDRFVSYPAFHHALMIRTFIGYSKYANDKQALAEAVKLADWDIAHSTPADWPYGNFPWSTYEAQKPGGFRDKSGLMPDKAAIMALAYIKLHEATGEKRFLQAAEAIAKTLAARQRPDGTWPFRVDPKTEAVIEEFTSSVIYAVRLFESLDKLNNNDRYRANRDKTWNWLVNGPIKTKEFRGFYEDIPASKNGRTNYDCLDTIRYLLANRTDTNGYLEMAKDLNTWVEKTFMDKIKGFEPAEGIREQLQCNVVMGIHSLNWASMLLDLAKATGDEKLKQRADQTANYITYYLQPDNRIVVGFQYNQWWYSCHAGVVMYLLDFLPPYGLGASEKSTPKVGAHKDGRIVEIRPGVMWKDDARADITAHGGCVIQMGGVFYWYGENNRQPGGGLGVFTGVRCYTSTDLTKWHNLGIVLAPTESGPLSAKDGRVAYRPKVLYNQRDAQYVMILTETGAGGGHLLFATSPSPTGPFTYRGWSFGANQSKTMDMGVYQEGEKAYVVYSDNNCGISIDRLSDDYLSVRERVAHIRNSECQCGLSHPNPNYKQPEGSMLKRKTQVLRGGEEGPAIVKAYGFYFLVTSWCSGWAPNQCHYRVSKSLEGPWDAEPDGYLGDETSFDSQSGYILTISGTKGSTFINISDRWKGGNTEEGSSYPWLPLQINGSTMTMQWYDTWYLDLENGTWSAGHQLSRFTQREPPCGITLSIIEQREEPVIAKGMPGTENNKYGFEGGCVLKLDGVYHLFTSEMVADPMHDKMMLAHWTSPDGLTWERRDTMFESSGSRDPQDIRSALWAPMPVYNEEEGRWNVFHVSFTPGDFGRIWRAVSSTKGRQGIHGPWVDAECILEGDPKWEGHAGCHSIFPYPVNGKWMAFYGSAGTVDHRTWWSAGLLSAERLAGPWKRETSLNPVTLSGVRGTENPVVTRLKSGRYVAVFDTLKNQPVEGYLCEGYGMDGHLIGYADSVDGVHWSAAKQLDVDCTKLWVKDIRTPLGLVEETDGTFTLFYTGFQRPAAGKPSKGWNQYRNVGLLKLRLTVNKE